MSLLPKNANILVFGRSPLAAKLTTRDLMNGIISTSNTCSPMKSWILRFVSLNEMSLDIVVNRPSFVKLLLFLLSLTAGRVRGVSNRRTVVCITFGRLRVSTHSSEDGERSMCPVCVRTANGFTFIVSVASNCDTRGASEYGRVTRSPCFSTALTLSVLYASRTEFSRNDGFNRPCGSIDARYCGLSISEKVNVLKLSAMKPALVLALPLASNTVNELVLDSSRLNVVNSNKSSTRRSSLPISFIVKRLFGI